jgi:hypothetical protein
MAGQGVDRVEVAWVKVAWVKVAWVKVIGSDPGCPSRW